MTGGRGRGTRKAFSHARRPERHQSSSTILSLHGAGGTYPHHSFIPALLLYPSLLVRYLDVTGLSVQYPLPGDIDEPAAVLLDGTFPLASRAGRDARDV